MIVRSINPLIRLYQDDEIFFDENPNRTFLVRNASPIEPDFRGPAWTLVVRASGRTHLHLPLPAHERVNASDHNNDAVGRYLFDCLTRDCTPSNTDSNQLAIIEEIRGRR